MEKTRGRGGKYMLDTGIEKKLFWQAIRELTFTPAISLPVLYESSAENKVGRKYYDEIKAENTQYIIESKRHKRLFKVFCCEHIEDKPLSVLVTLPKVYDEQLSFERISLFNQMAQLLGFNAIRDDSPSLSSLLEAAKLDGGNAENINDEIKKLYPYYYPGKRDGVDFIEYIFLLNVSLTTHNRTIGMLDRHLIAHNKDEKIDKWIRNVIDQIHSSSSCLSYIDTFFSIFYYIVAKNHNQNLDIINFVRKYEKTSSYEDLSYFTQFSFCKAWTDEPRVIEMLTTIMPIAWKILKFRAEHKLDKGSTDTQDDITDINTSQKAEEYANIIEAYINFACTGAIKILPLIFNNKY